MLRPDHLLTEIIRPTLEGLEADSPEAEALLLGTALAESGLRALRQDGGPALGLWQMEPGTHQDIWNNFLMYRAELTRRLQSTCRMDAPFYPEQLVWNLRYACALWRESITCVCPTRSRKGWRSRRRIGSSFTTAPLGTWHGGTLHESRREFDMSWNPIAGSDLGRRIPDRRYLLEEGGSKARRYCREEQPCTGESEGRAGCHDGTP